MNILLFITTVLAYMVWKSWEEVARNNREAAKGTKNRRCVRTHRCILKMIHHREGNRHGH